MRVATARQAPESDWPAMMLRRIDPSRNMSRFWSARLQPSLFEEVLLVRNWGRIGSRGQERSYWFSTRQAALSAFEKINVAKRRRGYTAESSQEAGRLARGQNS
jgi:predicted DNA-binding WGR domain protein